MMIADALVIKSLTAIFNVGVVVYYPLRVDFSYLSVGESNFCLCFARKYSDVASDHNTGTVVKSMMETAMRDSFVGILCCHSFLEIK